MWQLPRLTTDDLLIYLRKSRTDDPALTVAEVLAKHEQMLNDWVLRNLPGYPPVPESNRYREVVSGETIDSRPRVQELLRRMESPRVKAILIVEPQRLSRGDLEDIGRLVKLLRYTNTLVITLQYTYDLADERDRDMFERELKRGNEFLEYQKRIMGNGRILSVQNGNFIGQTPPYGYRKIVVKEGKRKCHTLEPVPEDAEVVRQIFELYAKGESTCSIARTLNAMGIPSPGGKTWMATNILPMLTNDHYIGMVHWNRRKSVKIIEHGELVTTRPRSKDFMSYPGKHPPIISQELWDRVQEQRGKAPPVKEKSRCVNPLSGLLRCQCGAPMIRQQLIKHGVQTSAPRMVCMKQSQCHTASCTVDEITQEVIHALKTAIADLDLMIEGQASDEALHQRKHIEQLEKRLENMDRQEISLWDKYTQESMPRHIFDHLREKLTQERQTVQQALSDARSAAPSPVDYEQRRHTLYAALEMILDPDAPARQINLLLKKCIERIIYNRPTKISKNRRYGTPEPMELDVHLRV